MKHEPLFRDLQQQQQQQGPESEATSQRWSAPSKVVVLEIAQRRNNITCNIPSEKYQFKPHPFTILYGHPTKPFPKRLPP